jgi:hypothetical protein
MEQVEVVCEVSDEQALDVDDGPEQAQEAHRLERAQLLEERRQAEHGGPALRRSAATVMSPSARS